MIPSTLTASPLAGASVPAYDTAESSLSQRTLHAFAWRLLSESAKLLLQIAVQVTLARLLPVTAFGMLAIASLVVNFGSRLSEIGTGPALIQRPTITPTHIRVGFSLSLGCGAAVTAAIFLGAPLLAAWFRASEVTPILRLIAVVFLVGSVGTTAEALMLRAMDYRRLLRVELISYGLGYGAIGIGLALLGYGVWALAWATVAQAAIKSALLLLMTPHPTRPSLARAETTDLLHFGIGVTLGRLASFAAQNADYLVVVRALGTTALGFYSRAYQLMCLPIYQFSSVVSSVLFPAYSTIQTDSERLRRGYLGSASVSAMVVFPTLAVIGLTAPEIMTGVFGSQWAPSAPPLRILCVGGAFYCVYNLAESLVRAKGAVYQKSICQTGYAIAVLAFGSAGSAAGIAGVAVGVVAATALAAVMMNGLGLRLIKTPWTMFLLSQRPALVVSLAVILAGVPLTEALHSAGFGALPLLAVTLPACAACAIAAAALLPVSWLDSRFQDGVAFAKQVIRRALADVRRGGRQPHESVDPRSVL